jgi:multiple sugar transport system ATP-binding protein
VVARLDPASKITEGENARLWIDGRKLHVFDPASGRNLTLGTTVAATDKPGGAPGSGAAAGTGTSTGTGEAAAEADLKTGRQAP